jgi:RNA polymerase sigma-70 factor (ECF subfamily)
VTDTKGLRELYAASHGRLVAAVAGMCGSVAEAEDCVQEAFAKAVPRWGTLATYDDPEAWVRQVAINLTRSRWRRRKRFSELAELIPAPASAPPPSPDHVALMAALRQLPAEQRETVVLHHLCDISIADIAAREGSPEGTVKARLFRARRALAGRLGLDEPAAHHPDEPGPGSPTTGPVGRGASTPDSPTTGTQMMKEVRING